MAQICVFAKKKNLPCFKNTFPPVYLRTPSSDLGLKLCPQEHVGVCQLQDHTEYAGTSPISPEIPPGRDWDLSQVESHRVWHRVGPQQRFSINQNNIELIGLACGLMYQLTMFLWYVGHPDRSDCSVTMPM